MTSFPSKTHKIQWQHCCLGTSFTLAPQSNFAPHRTLSTVLFFSHTPQPPSRHSACLLCFRLPHFLCFSFQSLPTRLQARGTEIRRSENSEQSPLLLQLSKLCFCFCFKYPYIWERGGHLQNNNNKRLNSSGGKKPVKSRLWQRLSNPLQPL